jgi:glucose/mannose transport system substrate-binding protein
MTLSGDWMRGYYAYAFGWRADVDYGEVSAPGTAAAYVSVIDSVAVPRGAPDYENVRALLAWFGSLEAQTVFSSLKGCVSPRRDVDRSRYDALAQRSAADLDTLALVDTLDLAAPGSFVDAFRDALRQWAADGDDKRLLGFLRLHYGEPE